MIDDNTVCDVNRDFPYLNSNCMRSISARVVNELFLNHIFSLAFTIHGGTESLTYPWGAPNHFPSRETNIPITDKQFLSDLAPDNNAEVGIVETVAKNSSYINELEYGNMSNIVYPVSGSMEDWAYSGSWEGNQIISTCKPETYTPYPEQRTRYGEAQKYSLRSIMFLLEANHDKNPPESQLGQRIDNCLLYFHNNAFNIPKPSEDCKQSDGYVNRIIRMGLTLIDLLTPYINYNILPDYTIEWVVGGAISVDETYVKYNCFTEEELKYYECPDNKTSVRDRLTNESPKLSGFAIWNKEYDKDKQFRFKIPPGGGGGYFVFQILAKVDKDWSFQVDAKPNIPPQTNIVNLRTNKNYVAELNGKFKLHGVDTFNTGVYKILIT
jgi:hypothetical protein